MKIHIVQKDESLWKIAQQYGVSLDELIANNTHISNPDQIMPGMKIKIPNTKHSHSDKTGKKAKKTKPKQQMMPSIQEDEQIDCAPLEKEMPALPMHFYPQTQPHLPPQSLPKMGHGADWDNVEYGKEPYYQKGMEGHYKGKKHHMHTMPHPETQSPYMKPSQQAPTPCQQPHHMMGYQGMHPSQAGCQPNFYPMGGPPNPYQHNIPPLNYGHPQASMQQPMMPNSVAGAQQMMPPQGMHPGMAPAMPQHQHPSTLPAQPSPYHHGNVGDCGCDSPRDEE